LHDFAKSHVPEAFYAYLSRLCWIGRLTDLQNKRRKEEKSSQGQLG